MPENARPNPYELLQKARAEEKDAQPPKAILKVIFGYSAGVGKTYTMLEKAQLLKRQNIDVVVGVVETHGRAETMALLQGLEVVPPRQIEYGGIVVAEMDIDAILTRKPQIVLVDELAHSNAPGSRHDKRYQDVEELLTAGISVYTTVNIQHIESANDTVFQISEVHVQETVPDKILELADEIELIDIPPEDLLKRFREGKVYVPAKAEQAMRRFFQIGNLMALRELSLRYTARHVEGDMVDYMKSHAIKGTWPAGNRILVCVGHDQASERMIRLAQQMAGDLNAEWYAIHVETPQQRELSDSAWEQLAANLRLAEELKGKVVILMSAQIASEILDFARANNINTVLVGATQQPRWLSLLGQTLPYELIRNRGSINIFIGGRQTGELSHRQHLKLLRQGDWPTLIYGALLVSLMTLVCFFLKPYLEFVNVVMFMMLPVVISSAIWGKRSGSVAALLAVVALDYFFVTPHFSFAVADFRYLPVFVIFVVVALTMSFFADLVRRQGANARQRERFVTALYSFSRDLMEATGRDDILKRAIATIAQAFECTVAILLPGGDGQLQLSAVSDGALRFDDKEVGVATWVYRNGEPAGYGTSTLSSSPWYHAPLGVHSTITGVISIRIDDPGKFSDFLSPDRRRLLDSFAGVVALALSRPA